MISFGSNENPLPISIYDYTKEIIVICDMPLTQVCDICKVLTATISYTYIPSRKLDVLLLFKHFADTTLNIKSSSLPSSLVPLTQ